MRIHTPCVAACLALVLLAPGVGAAPLEEQSRVKVRGHFEAGQVSATAVRRKDADDRDLEVVGQIQALDPEARLQVHGFWIELDLDRFDRRTRRWVARLEVGDWIKVEGDWEPEGEFLVDTLERPRGKARRDAVEGIVDGLRQLGEDRATFRLGPFAVETMESTEWNDFE